MLQIIVAKQAYDTDVWLAFLRHSGLVYRSTKGSHFQYDFPEGQKSLPRPVTVEQNWPEIPIDHISGSLRTMGKTMKDFRDFIKTQQKGGKKKKIVIDNEDMDTITPIPEKLNLKLMYIREDSDANSNFKEPKLD